jgi:hypothetical protein
MWSRGRGRGQVGEDSHKLGNKKRNRKVMIRSKSTIRRMCSRI